MSRVRCPPGAHTGWGDPSKEAPSLKSKDQAPCTSYLEVLQLQLGDDLILNANF